LPAAFDDVTVETPGTDVVEATGWDSPATAADRQYVHVGQRITHTASEEHPAERSDETAVHGDTYAANRLLGGITTGVAVGGILTVVAGIVLSSLSAIALAVAGAGGLAVASRLGRYAVGSLGIDAIGFPAGLFTAATLVSGLSVTTALSAADSFVIGLGLFGLGFLSYAVAWRL
jgi:uncharacterized membrane protein (Fun14 family)